MHTNPPRFRVSAHRFISAAERLLRWVCPLAVLLAGCADHAVDGAAGAGDPFFPHLGNGGYDVQRYILNLEVEPLQNSVRGLTEIDAVALARLQRFNLDFERMSVHSVEVDGKAAGFSHAGGELTITPARPLQKGSSFSVRVIYQGSPQPVGLSTPAGELPPSGWHRSPDGVINVMSEPNGAAGWFPLNNHPRDKALFRINVGVPAPWVVAASGELKEVRAEGERIHYIWEMDKPMAGYLASINIDRYQVEVSPGPHNILLRHYLPHDLDPAQKEHLPKIPQMLAYFETLFGPYPFEQYGLVVAGADLPVCKHPYSSALEGQTLTVFCPHLLGNEAALAHELAHQWFGNSVSLVRWQDVWLKEGPATYAEWLWRFRDQGIEEINRYAQTELVGYTPEGITGAPPVENLYGRYTYLGGALVMHALRLQVGDETFFRILREYQLRYRYGNAGTQEFIALCEEISGQDLTAFFDAWLYHTPPKNLPG